MPHRPPMRLVDSLLDCAGLAGTVESRIAADCPFLDSAGRLEPIALGEMMAQAYAVIKGYSDTLEGRPVKEGFLVGISRMGFVSPVTAGDRLRIQVLTTASLGAFMVAEGEIRCEGTLVAEGSFKVWIP